MRVGKIGKPKFLQLLRTSDSEFASKLFKLLDISDTGEINFREYIKIFSFIAKEGFNFSHKVQFIYKLISCEEDGTVTAKKLEKTMTDTLAFFPSVRV